MWAWIRDEIDQVMDGFCHENPSLKKKLQKIKEVASEKAKQDCKRQKISKQKRQEK